MNWIIRLIFDHLVAPGIRSKRSTLLGLLAFFHVRAQIAALAGCGVQITERVPHALPANPHNHKYLATKRDRAGHLL